MNASRLSLIRPSSLNTGNQALASHSPLNNQALASHSPLNNQALASHSPLNNQALASHSLLRIIRHLQSACLNHDGVTTMERLDQGHLRPLLVHPRQTFHGQVRIEPPTFSTAGGHYSKDLPVSRQLTQLINLIHHTTHAINQDKKKKLKERDVHWCLVWFWRARRWHAASEWVPVHSSSSPLSAPGQDHNILNWGKVKSSRYILIFEVGFILPDPDLLYRYLFSRKM